MVTFTQTELQLNVDQIIEIEKYAGLNFPQEYTEHLLQHNGGQPSPNTFKFNENGNWTESCIDWFLAIYDGEFDNLKDYIWDYKFEEKRLPNHMLPIAHDPGGNLICISCGLKDKGYIYFWDHENEVDYSSSDDSDYSNLYLVSETFNGFINNLR